MKALVFAIEHEEDSPHAAQAAWTIEEVTSQGMHVERQAHPETEERVCEEEQAAAPIRNEISHLEAKE